MTRKLEYIVNDNRHCLADAVNLMNCDVIQLEDMAEDSKNGAEFLALVNKVCKGRLSYELDRENSSYARLLSIDPFGNRHYLVAYK